LLVEPPLPRTVVVELDAVFVGVAQVHGDRQAVVLGPIDGIIAIVETPDREGQLAPAGVENGEVVEARVPGRRGRAPSLSNVFRPPPGGPGLYSPKCVEGVFAEARIQEAA
jgi:hypothetical protein